MPTEAAQTQQHLARPLIIATDVRQNLPELGQIRRCRLQNQLGRFRVGQDRAERLIELIKLLVAIHAEDADGGGRDSDGSISINF